MAQIEALYDKQAGTLVGNCDTTVFLGSGEEKTMKSISERIGKTTVDHRSSSTTKGQQGSFSQQDRILGRELITADEVGRMDNSECIVFIRGLRPFKSKKYNITKHPNYKKTGDFKEVYMFDVSSYDKEKAEKEEQEIEDFNIEEYILDDDIDELPIV